MLEEFKNHLLATSKVSFQDYLKNTKKTEKEIKDSFKKEAETRAKNFLILKEISKEEKIEVPQQEIEQEMNKILKSYPDIEKAKKDLDPDKLKIYTELVIRNEKTFKLLESFAK
jgi:FKBP-type peptidyl-prolyl cis-trans isomerase (trigger factor)